MSDQTPRDPGRDEPGHPYGHDGDTARFGGLGWHGEPDREHPAGASPYGPGPAYGAGSTGSAPASGGGRRGGGRIGGGLLAGLLAGTLLVGGLGGVLGAAAYQGADGRSSSPAVGPSASASPSTSSVVDGSRNAAPAADSVEAVAGKVLPSVVKINVANSSEQGSGSGIVISSDGEILTNNHVASVAGQSGDITVSFNDGSTKRAKIVGTDPVTDLAVVKAEGVSGLTPASIGASDPVDVGENVVAIGSPFGLQATVTSGIVSALNRPVSVGSTDQSQPQLPGSTQGPDATTYPAIQTDAAINPGNSGGPLVNLNGDVIGINSSIRTASDSTASGGSIGLGFAIPIAKVWPIVQQLRSGETPTHARMGVSVVDASSNGGLLTGAGVSDVTAGSAAAAAGLKKGDVITKVDHDVIGGSESLVATVRGHRPGDKVTLTVVTGSRAPRTLEVTLDSDAG
jgi:putative serine protease PepD